MNGSDELTVNRPALPRSPGKRGARPRGGFRLAAIDLDGTLLGPDLSISADNLSAIQTLQAMGTEVVLASGRHYFSMRPFAERVPGMRWIVSSQGGEISDVAHRVLLHRAFLTPADIRQVLELSVTLGFATVAYAPDEIFTLTKANPEMRLYEQLEGRAAVLATLPELLTKNLFKIFWIAEPDRLDTLPGLAQVEALPLQKVRSHAHVYEFMPKHVSKGAALDALASHLKIRPAEAVVFGDAENDIPMFEWAGTAVAMAHGWPTALAKATLIAPAGPKETALSRGIAAALGLRRGHVTAA